MTSLPASLSGKKIALVHDFLLAYGGAERVLEELAALFPEAPLYTLLSDPELVRARFPDRDIRVSRLAQLPAFLRRRHRLLLPLFPAAVEAFDLREFDLVISSSGAWSKGIVTRLNTRHIAYLHSPMRYAWDYHEKYLQEVGGKRWNLLPRLLLSYLRIWDRQAADRPDSIVSNSEYTRERVKKYYRRESARVYPYALSLKEGATDAETRTERAHFLFVSRLTRSKKADIVVEAFNKLGLPLVIVGTGPERKALERGAQPNIRFAGFCTDAELRKLYGGARALIFPSEEDFGMTAVEALSFGVPVIAFDYGGIKEIVEPGTMGEFFQAQTPEILAEGIRRFLVREGAYDTEAMRKRAALFGREQFRSGILAVLEASYRDAAAKGGGAIEG